MHNVKIKLLMQVQYLITSPVFTFYKTVWGKLSNCKPYRLLCGENMCMGAAQTLLLYGFVFCYRYRG